MKMQIAIIFSLFFNVHNGAPYSWSCPQHSTKTRLCARGLEELPYFRTDTSTCSWKGIRIPLTTIASQKWQLHSLNIKTSIPLSKINPEKCFSPPTKRKPIPTNLLHLKNCLYGEASTSRYWYLSIKEELTKLNRHILPADQAIFIWHHSNHLIGIITCLVDDRIWSGTWVLHFHKTVIKKLKIMFKTESESIQAFN